MDMYKNLIYLNNPGEEKVQYNDITYYRYMDKIYIPNLPSELSQEDVSSLSEIRIKLNGDVIDYSYTKELISVLIERIPSVQRATLLDFGCGGGILSEILSENNCYGINKVIGVDLCQFAVSTSIKSYNEVDGVEYEAHIFNSENTLPLDDCSVDGLISSFVMHFPIYDNQLKELYRVLSHGGRFVYNDYVYYKYPSHMKSILSRLKKVGFDVSEEVVEFRHPDTKDIKKHKLITATKP